MAGSLSVGISGSKKAWMNLFCSVKRKQKVILEDVLIENYAAEGKSLARVNGKVVFVENVVPGDVVDIQLYKSKKDWAEGFPLQIKKLSENSNCFPFLVVRKPLRATTPLSVPVLA